MSKIHICREHDLDEQACQVMAEELLQKLVGKFGGRYKPKGNKFVYKHTAGVTAEVEPRDGELDVSVKLGLMTRAMAPQLEREMTKVLDEYLADQQ
jgi:putative polyhydroxyalkanoate system protein